MSVLSETVGAELGTLIVWNVCCGDEMRIVCFILEGKGESNEKEWKQLISGFWGSFCEKTLAA